MRLYIEAEVPDICYVTEAAYWVALGRVPAFHMEERKRGVSEYEMVDFRLGEEAEWDGTLGDITDYFLESEFRAFGIEIDYERYFDGIYGTSGFTTEEYMDRLKRISPSNLRHTGSYRCRHACKPNRGG